MPTTKPATKPAQTTDLTLTPDVLEARPGERHTGERRAQVAESVKALYLRGLTVRAISAKTNMAYGKVHRLLAQAGTELRSRSHRTYRAGLDGATGTGAVCPDCGFPLPEAGDHRAECRSDVPF
jgi:hypothetical protein